MSIYFAKIHTDLYKQKKMVILSRKCAHSSEIRGLCLIKCPRETVENLPYFCNLKIHIVFFIWCYFIFFPNECPGL